MTKKLPQKKKVRGSIATYRLRGRQGDVLDLLELADTLRQIGKVPERIGWLKACEIAYMANYCYYTFRRELNEEVSSKLDGEGGK